MWPTPNALEKGGGEYQDPEKIRERMEKGHQTNLAEAVKSGMWPTPTASEGTGPQENTGRTGGKSLRETAALWPTPTVQDSANNGGPSQFKRNSLPLNAQVHVTPETGPRTTGALNPMWVAWLMGYPTGYLSCVHWETRSSRRSRKK
jgi:hypothetical protein